MQTNGPNWPNGGEIDVIEGVNDQATNQMTVHTGSACTLDTAYASSFTGHVLGTNCLSTQQSNAGCAISDSNSTSFGYGFNQGGGGVFAVVWDNSSGIGIWFFPRSKIPSNITSHKINLQNWGKPVGFWSSATCNLTENFYSHSLILDTTICGDWAGATYSSSGCPGTCSQMVANASNFVGQSDLTTWHEVAI